MVSCRWIGRHKGRRQRDGGGIGAGDQHHWLGEVALRYGAREMRMLDSGSWVCVAVQRYGAREMRVVEADWWMRVSC